MADEIKNKDDIVLYDSEILNQHNEIVFHHEEIAEQAI